MQKLGQALWPQKINHAASFLGQPKNQERNLALLRYCFEVYWEDEKLGKIIGDKRKLGFRRSHGLKLAIVATFLKKNPPPPRSLGVTRTVVSQSGIGQKGKPQLLAHLPASNDPSNATTTANMPGDGVGLLAKFILDQLVGEVIFLPLYSGGAVITGSNTRMGLKQLSV